MRFEEFIDQVSSVNTSSDIFTVNGDYTYIDSGNEITISKSTGNDNTYTINSISYNSSADTTDLETEENIGDSTADGNLWLNIKYHSIEHERTEDNFQKLTTLISQEYYAKIGANREFRLIDEVGTTDEIVFFAGKTRDRGEGQESGEVQLKVYGFGYELLPEPVSISETSSTDNISVMSALVNSFLDPPSGNSFTESWILEDITSHSISLYSAINTKKFQVVNEMTENYGAVFFFQNGYECYYQDHGTVDSGTTIDTSSDNAKITSCKKDIIEDMVTKCRVIGTTKDGSKKSSTADESDVSESLNLDINKFKQMNVGYLSLDTEAEEIAEANLILEPEDKITLEVSPKYKTSFINEVVHIKDDNWNIDKDFVVEKQYNYFGRENKTVFELSSYIGNITQSYYSDQRKEERGLRNERKELIEQKKIGVGDQNYNVEHGDRQVTADTDVGDINTSATTTSQNPYDNFVNDNHDHGQPNETTDSYTLASIEGSDSTTTDLDSGWNYDVVSVDINGTFDFVFCYVKVDANFSAASVNITLDFDGPGSNEPQITKEGVSTNATFFENTYIMPVFKSTSSDINIDIDTDYAGSYDVSLTVWSNSQAHSHDLKSRPDTDEDTTGGNNSSVNSQLNANGSTDSGQTKTTSGSTNSDQSESGLTDSKQINIYKEDKDDR